MQHFTRVARVSASAGSIARPAVASRTHCERAPLPSLAPRARSARPLLQMLALAGAFALSACSSGGAGGGGGGSSPPPTTPPPTTPPPAANRAPTAANDILQVSSSASIDVLANDRDPDGDALTVTITEQPFVGTAAVNTNGTVRIDGLPSGFRGMTRFAYQVRDPGGLTATANAAIFVNVKPYRLAFAADAARNGAGDLYITDFAAPPVKVASLIDATKKQVSYRVARSGTTAAFVRADGANVIGTEELWYVRTQPLGTPVRVTLPAPLFRSGGAQYALSPDGNWLVVIAGSSSTQQTLHVLDVRTGGGALAPVTVAAAPVASNVRFSADSRFVYWFGRASTQDTRGTLWRMPLDRSTAPVQISGATDATTGIVNYTVLETQSLVVAGRENASTTNVVVAIDPATPGTERVLSTAAAGEDVDARAITLSPDETKFTYSTVVNGTYATYVASVSGTPAPRLLIPRTSAIGAIPAAIRPDNAALLYLRSMQQGTQTMLQYFETPLDTFVESAIATALAPFVPPTDGVFASYDGSNDRIVFERGLEFTNELANEVDTISRAQFGSGTPVKMGAPGQVSPLRNFTAISRGAVVLGERAPNAPSPVQPVLANVAAPDKTFALTPGVAYGVDGQIVQMVDAAP